MKMNGADMPPTFAPHELAERAHHGAAGVGAVEISVGHYESGFPMVRGTFDRCLRNMLQEA